MKGAKLSCSPIHAVSIIASCASSANSIRACVVRVRVGVQHAQYVTETPSGISLAPLRLLPYPAAGRARERKGQGKPETLVLVYQRVCVFR